MSLRESVIKVGRPIPLIGILTEAGQQCGDTAFILLNSGIMHRVGACRLSVRIARTVALRSGLPCVRFDFSGIGDSEPRRSSGVDFDQAALDEVVEVMDYLQEARQINKFILYGLCSGAMVSCKAAELDDRVAAVAQVDGCCYPTVKGYIKHYGSRLCSVERWQARLARWLRIEGKAKNDQSVLSGGKADFEVPEFSEDPGRELVSEQLRKLMKKNIKLHCVFTGSTANFCYRNQYRDCFRRVRFGRNLNVEYYPNASHIFTEPFYQRQLVEGLVKWLGALS